MNMQDESCASTSLDDTSTAIVVGDPLLLEEEMHDGERQNYEHLRNDKAEQNNQEQLNVFSFTLDDTPDENNCNYIAQIVHKTDDISPICSLNNYNYTINGSSFSNFGLNTIGYNQALCPQETREYENANTSQHSSIAIPALVDAETNSENISFNNDKENRIVVPSNVSATYKDLSPLHKEFENKQNFVIRVNDNDKVVIPEAKSINLDLNVIKLENANGINPVTSNEEHLEDNTDSVIIGTDVTNTSLPYNCTSFGGDIRVRQLPMSTYNYEIPVINCTRKCSQCDHAISKTSSNKLSWQTMEFCDTNCLLCYQKTLGEKCTNCNVKVNPKLMGRYFVRFGKNIRQFCSLTCLSRYTKNTKQCVYCYNDAVPGEGCANNKNFCSRKCIHKAELAKTKKLAEQTCYKCCVCLKHSRITIQYVTDQQVKLICGQKCFATFRFSNDVRPQKCSMCSKYFDIAILKQHTLFNNDVAESFCSEHCKVCYIISHQTLYPCRGCNEKKRTHDMIQRYTAINIERWCSLECLKPRTPPFESSALQCGSCFESKRPAYLTAMPDSASGCNSSNSARHQTNPLLAELNKSSQVHKSVKKSTNSLPKRASKNSESAAHVARRSPPEIVQTLQKHREWINTRNQLLPQRNMSTMCKPATKSIGTNHNIMETRDKETQTSSPNSIVPAPKPFPVFVPVPFPAPVFVPIPQNSYDCIMLYMKDTNDEIPSDPAGADMLLMAFMISSFETKSDNTANQSGSGWKKGSTVEITEIVDSNEPGINNIKFDIEQELETVTLSSMKINGEKEERPIAKKRKMEASVRRNMEQQKSKKRKRKSEQFDIKVEDISLKYECGVDEKVAAILLKYEYGVDEMNQFIKAKLSTWQDSQLAVLNSDKLCQALCMFITEIRKPNMEEYAPDTILYLCMGIQYYLFQQHGTDNIFWDAPFAKFTDILHQILGSFCGFQSESHFIVTRIEEEHLWESNLLGPHSPLTLLNTLMYFNTKYFSLKTTEMHMQISFSQILKNWKNLSGSSKSPVLRFYPKKGQSFKKVFYEQHEDENNELRCPVKFYEFYLNKSPGCTRTRDDVFYLCPEKSSIGESPVWYSTSGLSLNDVDKMLRRIKLVKEINIAFLSE